jgi:SAM-dependent methyltransferase
MRMRSENDISLASAARNLGSQALGLEAVPWKAGATILDFGCGPGVHLDFFRSKGLVGTGLDRNADYFRYHGEIEHVTDPAHLGGRQFDYLFASHVLEHCPNTFQELSQWSALLKPGGTMVIFVPPFCNEVSNDHWNIGWNVGQLAMTMVAAGLDCRESTFYQTADQVFGFGIKRGIPASFMIEEALPFLPPAVRQGVYYGDGYQKMRADIGFVSGDRIEYLARRAKQVAVPLPDETWLSVEREGWSDVTAVPREPIREGVPYLLAVETEQDGYLRVAFCHEGLQEHAEVWMETRPGLNIRQFECIDMDARTPGFEASNTDAVAIGGPTEFVRAAVFRDGQRVV